MHMETMNAGRDTGEIGDHFDAILAGVLKVNRPFGGRAAGRVERGRCHRTLAAATSEEEKCDGNNEKFFHTASLMQNPGDSSANEGKRAKERCHPYRCSCTVLRFFIDP